MTGLLAHRGPNNQSTKLLANGALGHTRLSILDLSDAGRQPMRSGNGRFTIVYNGEIYNFKALRAELISLGSTFRSQSDTEVVLEAFARWGRSSLGRFNGIFAFAIWDEELETLLLARDRFGVKPLYYCLEDGAGIRFGSEIKAVLAAEGKRGGLDRQALHELMHYGVGGLGARTLFADVRKLQAGEYLEFNRGMLSRGKYWELNPEFSCAELLTDPVTSVRNLLEAAVKRQLVSDVPVGVFLSGGIDSSAVTAFAARNYGGGLKTYSVGFDFAGDSSELPKAAAVARHFGTEHHELFIKGVDLPAVIESLVKHHDDAFSDAANIPLYLLCKELQGGVRVVLQGDGGDEIFGGYRRYSMLARADFLRAAAWIAQAGSWLPLGKVSLRRIQRMIDIWQERNSSKRMALLLAQDECCPAPTRILGPGLRASVEREDPFARYREIGARLQGLDPVQGMLWTDTQILLPDIFLEKVDKSTMAWGVESRVPFLDNELTDYVLALPAALKMPGAKPKALLKSALRGIVPDYVLDAPKQGFGVPYGNWLRGPLANFARERMCNGRAAADGLIDGPVAARLLSEHISRQNDHGFLLWKTLNLALWYERYLPSLDSATS